MSRRGCEHEDVRYSKGERGAVACYVCGRLFGHLHDDGKHGLFVAYNPAMSHRANASTPEASPNPSSTRGPRC
jgi:hypothetical protein